MIKEGKKIEETKTAFSWNKALPMILKQIFIFR
jgi:hypothetical protein